MTALRHQVGQLLLVGLGGPVLDPAECAWLRLLRPGGFVLFRRNIEEAKQTTALLREAMEAAAADGERTPALRALDLEGGLVDRLRDLLAPMPSAAAVAASGRAYDAEQHGRLIGRAARLLGFNTPFAPVLDLALPASRPVMRTRVAGETGEAVVAYAKPFLQALRAERVLGCGKHFPGLGGGALDSHRELLPLLPIVMVAHAGYPRVAQSASEPASVSRFWITDVLRKRVGYDGLILTDDMEMGGLLTRMSLREAAVRALLAGADLLEICKEPALIFEAYEAVLGEAERSPAFARTVRRAHARVTAHKGRLLDAQLPRDATAAQLTRLRTDILQFHARVESAEKVPA